MSGVLERDDLERGLAPVEPVRPITVNLGGIGGLLNGLLRPPGPLRTPAEERLSNAQAEVLELQAHELRSRLLVPVEASDPRDVLPGRFELCVIGPKGSGKTRWAKKLDEAWPGRVRWFRCRGESSLPRIEWERGDLLILDDVGHLLPKRRGDPDPTDLERLLVDARQDGVSAVFITQTSKQVPEWLLEHGVLLLVTAAPWLWRALSREYLTDNLDSAHAVLRRSPPGSVALVSEGVAECLRWT